MFYVGGNIHGVIIRHTGTDIGISHQGTGVRQPKYVPILIVMIMSFCPSKKSFNVLNYILHLISSPDYILWEKNE